MDEKSLAIATFRYALIAPALNMSRKERREYFRIIAHKEYDVPCLGIKIYKAATFNNWYNLYKRSGFDKLTPSARSDSGISKRITENTAYIIAQIIADCPSLSISGIHRMLLGQGYILKGEFSESTLRNYINAHDLRKINATVTPRKKFEKDHVNQLWTSDFMSGPYLNIRGKKKQAFICGIIDDHSRLIVGAGWYFHENCLSLAITLKQALSIYGLPDAFYCDNGKSFRTNYLHQVCGRLGIALIYSRPYDSPSRGKIERFWHTLRTKFLSLLDVSSITTLDELNAKFDTWLQHDYHAQFHHGINARPIDRYLDDARLIKLRTISSHELDAFFLHSITRKVKKDATVSINSTLYEVPVEFIGKTVELRFPIDDPTTFTIYENDKPVCLIRPVNLSLNATKPYTGIHFKNLTSSKGDTNDD